MSATGAAGAGLLTLDGLQPRRARAQQTGGGDVNLINAAINTSAIQAANSYYDQLGIGDWVNLTNVHRSLLANARSSDIDGTFMHAISGVQVSDIMSAQLDTNVMLQQIQIYCPEFTAADIKLVLSRIPYHNSPDLVAAQLTLLQQGGLSGHFERVANFTDSLTQQAAARATGSIGVPKLGTSGRTTKTSPSPWVRTTNPYHLMYPPPAEDGGPSSYCPANNAAIYATGVAFAIIGSMLGPLGILAEAAFWTGFLTYGAVGVSGWATVTAAYCWF